MEKEEQKVIEIGLENIVEMCDKTTTGNLAHNIPSIKFMASSLLKICRGEL